MNQEYFTFELASSIQMGIALDSMRTVCQFEVQNICTVPGVANFWYGVVNYKGSLLWILDSDRYMRRDKAPLLNGAGDIKAGGNPQPHASDLPNKGLAPMSSLHHFSNISAQKRPRLQKLTTVILKPETDDGHKQVAIATKRLQGILAIKPSSLQSLKGHPSQLQQCCNAVAQTDGETIYLIDTTKFLEQLHRRSILVSA